MSLCNHLQRRGSSGNYYFRVRIPSDILEVYAPKKEIVFSLKTKDPKEAKARCRVEAVRIDQEFEEHRRRLELERRQQEQLAQSQVAGESSSSAAPLTDLDSVPDYELDRLAVLYLHEVLAHDEQERAAGSTEARKEWEENQEFLRQLHEQKGIPFTPEAFPAQGVGLSPSVIQRKRERARLFLSAGGSYLASGDTSIIHDRALAFLGAHGLKVEDQAGSLAFRRLCLSLIQKEMEAQEAILKRLDGQWIPTPPASQGVTYCGSHSASAGLVVGSPVVLQVNGQGQTVQAQAQDASLIPSEDNPCLSTIWESYLKERKPAPSTVLNFEGAVRRFIELVGDLPVKAVTKSHFRQYKDALLKFPARLPHAVRKKTIQQVLEFVEKEQQEGSTIKLLNSKTINDKYLGALKAILAHAVDNGFIDDNPANQIRVTHNADKHGDDEPATLPYTEEELNVLFSSSFFVPGQECKFKKRLMRDYGADAVLDYRWLPIVALFTGARLEEIGQLDVADVMEEDGVKFLFIHADQSTERRLKNKSSRRKVPIHPRLVELGFLEFVELRQKQGAVKLFSTLKEMKGRPDKRTDTFSKWWSRYTKKIGVKPLGEAGEQKTFHSFRHTSKRALRNAGVDPSLTDAIHGHTNKSISAHYGRDKDGMGYALPVLLEAISKARMDEIEIHDPNGW
ncbi:Phage integrase family protein [anaerobic digester metagenome]